MIGADNKLEFLKKNRSAAIIALVLAVVLCIPLGTLRSVSGIENKVQREFTEKDKFGETVDGTLGMLKYHITSFADEYEKALGKSEHSEMLRRGAEAIGSSAVSDEKLDLSEIKSAASAMHSELDREGAYTAEAKSAFVNMDSDISILKKYDSYNKAASDYNKIADSFIGKLFGLGFAAEF